MESVREAVPVEDVTPTGATSQTTTLSTRSSTPDPPRGQWIPPVLAFLIVLGFFGVLGALICVEVPASASSTVSIMLGALTASVSTVVSFYFGSSQQSARKTELLSQERKSSL